jgi:hypothetical protein
MEYEGTVKEFAAKGQKTSEGIVLQDCNKWVRVYYRKDRTTSWLQLNSELMGKQNAGADGAKQGWRLNESSVMKLPAVKEALLSHAT